jgi:membrane fusion protein (multidrug efflux system)
MPLIGRESTRSAVCRPRNGYRAATLVLPALALTLLAGCDKPQAHSQAAATSSAVSVVTAESRIEPMGVDIEAVGTTRAKESVQVTSKASNTITAIRFNEGDAVQQGAVLIEMDDRQAQAALAGAEASLVRSKSQFDRGRDLSARQAMSAADLEQTEAQLKADQARVNAARAGVADTVIRAPFNGRTGFRQVSVGSYVSAGTPITTLDDTSVIKLDFTVPETYLFVLRRGLPVKAASTGLPGRSFAGEVTTIESRVDPVTRSITVRAELPNPEGLLRQGMFMTVSLQGQVEPTLLVPEEALVPERGRTYVFVVRNNVVERHEVKTGKRRPGDVQIVEGIAEHDRVVVEGTQNVRDGTQVQETNSGAS